MPENVKHTGFSKIHFGHPKRDGKNTVSLVAISQKNQKEKGL